MYAPEKRVVPRIIGWMLVLIIFCVAGLFIKGFYLQDKVAKTYPKNVTITLVRERDVEVRAHFIGTVFPSETVTIKSRIDSQITKISFKNGDVVKEGETLFELDDRVIKAQLEQAKANLQRDEAEVVRAKAHFERDKKLVDKGVSSKEQYDTSTQAFKASQANVAADKAHVENLEAQLTYTKIKAPITGHTGTITLTTGNVVKANDPQPLVIINKLNPIRIQTAIPQEYFDDIHQGQQKNSLHAQITDLQNNLLSNGAVTYKENAFSEQTRSLDVHLILENEEKKLWPGMFVNVSLLLKTLPQAKIVPEHALQQGQLGQVFVYTIQEGKAKKVPVTVLYKEGADAAIKADDIHLGDPVITDGFLNLKEGDFVKSLQESHNISTIHKPLTPHPSSGEIPQSTSVQARATTGLKKTTTANAMAMLVVAAMAQKAKRL